MRLRISFSLIARAVVCGPLLLLSAVPALAQPARIGLVVGNSNYSALPALPGCQVSSRDLAKALRGLGYQVVERQDVTSGGLAAAISEFSRGMESTPGASVFVYICGYAAGMNDRPFLLPVSASIRRPSDVMTQGMLAKAILDVLVRGNPSRGLVALDVVPMPDASAPVLDTLTERACAGGRRSDRGDRAPADDRAHGPIDGTRDRTRHARNPVRRLTGRCEGRSGGPSFGTHRRTADAVRVAPSRGR